MISTRIWASTKSGIHQTTSRKNRYFITFNRFNYTATGALIAGQGW